MNAHHGESINRNIRHEQNYVIYRFLMSVSINFLLIAQPYLLYNWVGNDRVCTIVIYGVNSQGFPCPFKCFKATRNMK